MVVQLPTDAVDPQFSFPIRMKITRLVSILSLVLGLGVTAASAQDAEGVYTKFDKNPTPTRTPPPDFPNDMQGTNGIVAVVVIIDEKGAVTQATVSKSSHPQFEGPSLQAIKNWKFKPAEVGGQPVKAKVTIPLHFNSSS
jgi:periplasmic protein TonB